MSGGEGRVTGGMCVGGGYEGNILESFTSQGNTDHRLSCFFFFRLSF